MIKNISISSHENQKLVLLFGAGADLDALETAVRGDRLLLETFRNLEAAKEDEGYLDAFEHLFGGAPKLSYTWKSDVKGMIHRALRNRPLDILACDNNDEQLRFGNVSIPVCRRFFEILQDPAKERQSVRMVLFHMVSAIYGAVSVGQIQAGAADTIQAGFNQAGVDVSDDMYNQINLQVHVDPEKVLTDSVVAAIEAEMENANGDEELSSVVVRLLDYTVVFDKVFSDLTTDRDQIGVSAGQTAPLRRALHFLFSLKITAAQMDGEVGEDSYYHRIPDDAAVFTMNYTTAVGRVITARNIDARIAPIYLHGKHTECFDLLTGELNPESGGIPFLMPQTSSKPIVSVETVRRLSAFLRAADVAEHLVTIGYGFNKDDDHVNNMIFDCMLRNSALHVTILSRDDINASAGVTRLRQRFKDRIRTEKVSHDALTARNKFEEIISNA